MSRCVRDLYFRPSAPRFTGAGIAVVLLLFFAMRRVCLLMYSSGLAQSISRPPLHRYYVPGYWLSKHPQAEALFAAQLLSREREQRQMTRTLYSTRQTALVFGTSTGLTARPNLPAIRQVAAK